MKSEIDGWKVGKGVGCLGMDGETEKVTVNDEDSLLFSFGHPSLVMRVETIEQPSYQGGGEFAV